MKENINFEEMTSNMIFEHCANKSIEEINEMVVNGVNDRLIHESLRYAFNRVLAFDSVVECTIKEDDKNCKVKANMDAKEGLICFYFNDEKEPYYFDELDDSTLIDILRVI